MVNIRLGWGSLLVASILAIGYVVMFVTVLMGSSGSGNSNLMRDEIIDLQMRLDMASKIAPPVIVAPTPSSENKATRPGVIVLGMHRSGIDPSIIMVMFSSCRALSQRSPMSCYGKNMQLTSVNLKESPTRKMQ